MYQFLKGSRWKSFYHGNLKNCQSIIESSEAQKWMHAYRTELIVLWSQNKCWLCFSDPLFLMNSNPNETPFCWDVVPSTVAIAVANHICFSDYCVFRLTTTTVLYNNHPTLGVLQHFDQPPHALTHDIIGVNS